MEEETGGIGGGKDLDEKMGCNSDSGYLSGRRCHRMERENSSSLGGRNGLFSAQRRGARQYREIDLRM